MKQVVIAGEAIKGLMPGNKSIERIELKGVPITVALIETPDIQFDSRARENRLRVLVRKRAFSANYRDIAIALGNNKLIQEKNSNNREKVSFIGLGSDFVADVIAVGREVTDVQVGDRVINDADFPYKGFSSTPDYEGATIGLPTNSASKELEIFHQKKIIKIPPEMTDEVAASFTIGGITSYSMVRKLNLKKGEKVLVTAVKSNTSLFCINALKKWNVDIYGLSTSTKHIEKIKALGVKEVIIVDKKNHTLRENQKMKKVVFNSERNQFEGFDGVIDPFFDVYLSEVIHFMNAGARYTTCGQYDQFSHLTGESFQNHGMDLRALMNNIFTMNKQIIGNCLGFRSDLEDAINDHVSGKFNVVIDSIFSGEQVADFINATYNSSDRFGKVVYKF